MRSILFILAISILSLGDINAKIYYVSPSGNNTNSGLSLSLAWKTLTYAAGSSSPVVAGDTVYVKSGSYGAEKVVFQKSGTVSKPISFLGYTTTPGDAPPILVWNTTPYAAFLSTDMPTFDGGNRASGIAFDCTKRNFLIIKNFQIQNYAYGVIGGDGSNGAGNLVLYNINIMSVGDINASYSGEGILLGSMGTSFSHYNTLENCLVVNASAEGLGINGNYNKLIGCEVYCNENTTADASTDYYIIICGSYNILQSCYVERLAGLDHAGHGISVKSNAEQVVDKGMSLPVINPQYNKILYCGAKNMGESFCVRHRGTQYNLFYHCKATGTHTGDTGSSMGEGNCINTRDGASNNTFDGCIAENCAAGFVFEDTVEDGDTGTNPPGHPGNNNKYINCLIYNCYTGVSFSDYSIQSDAGNNTIANCTFYKTRYLHSANRHCANMKYIGNIYYGCLPTSSGGAFKGGSYNTDILPNGTNTYFKNCDFINIQGGMPTNFISNSISSITKDPLFVNATGADFHLKPKSPCIDASIILPTDTTDYDSIYRPQGISDDIGAYEFSPFTAEITNTNVKCNGGNDGSATATISGGSPPYTYYWSNGQTASLNTGLSAGVYTVNLFDMNTYPKTLTVTITQPSPLTVSNVVVTNASACAVKDGSIKLGVSGGTGNYTFRWSTSPVQTTNLVSGLSIGQYSVVISDVNGCSTVATETITCSSTTDVISLQNENSLIVYPNPSSGLLNVVAENDNNEITISDLVGRELYKVKSASAKTEINMGGIANGVYFLRVENSKQVKTIRIVLSK